MPTKEFCMNNEEQFNINDIKDPFDKRLGFTERPDYQKKEGYSYVAFWGPYEEKVTEWVSKKTKNWDLLWGPDIPNGQKLPYYLDRPVDPFYVEVLESDLEEEEVEKFFRSFGCGTTPVDRKEIIRE